ncbi:Galactokinase [Niveomyces insectorum RCEF 264]|uniref:Galactokinase n=1 Tax=Niveomyces insectorum RCEF 264 TaxID=1081102 RepID=A0A167UQP5_9HYPO|nr:Galactokinase [Niveomyces insectorum RCEF 264]
MAGIVPVVHALSDIYPATALEAQTKRWETLLSAFEAKYGQPADFVARSPGRVNIIGEHIDYSLYSVLPMAISEDCLVAVRVVDDRESGAAGSAGSTSFNLQIANLQDAKFPAHEFALAYGEDVAIDASVHEWTNYFKSGLRGALALLRTKHGHGFRPKSMQILMDGTVPVGGGLSSSAAFTSASALSVMAANNETAVDKTELTELAIVSERFVGVNSGGMDQSASVFAERGSALFVTFTPTLSARPVSFPTTNPEICFLIAQTFVAADKFVTGPVNYNLRVVECTLAAAYLNARLNAPGTVLPRDASPLGISLHGFHEAYFSAKTQAGGGVRASAERELHELLELVSSTLTQPEGYTREEVSAVLGVSVDELNARYMSRFPVRAERFKLQQRARHVFGEALRVFAFMALLNEETHHPTTGPDTTAFNARLGALLNASQDSCRDLYECSCPELDELCTIARGAGSYGSRLTGAGWGGCSVHLVPANKVAEITDAWERGYYAKRALEPEQKSAAVLASRPGSGSAVFVVEKKTS